MGEVVKTKGDAKADPADIVAAEQKKREKNKARDAKKKAAAEEKKKEKEEELKKQRKYQLQQVNSIRNKDHHSRQLPRLHHAPPPVQANAPTAPVACTRFLVTQLETVPVLKMAPISSADASENIDINQPAPVTSENIDINQPAPVTSENIDINQPAPVTSENIDVNQPAPVTSVSSSTGSEERSFFVGRILFRISSSSDQTNTNDQQQTNNNVRLEFGKDTDQITIMCSQINKDNNNAAAATEVPGTTTVTNQLADELNMKEKQVVSDAKTTMNPAMNSDDDDDKFEEARGKGLIRAEQIALNAKATERTENQAERKKTQARRKDGYNKFSVLLEELENEEEQDIDREAEEAATKTEEKPHESEKEQDMEARRAEEAATTARKKREKRERKKKRKIVAVATTIEEKSHDSGSDAKSWSSVGVLSLALVCFLSLTAFYMS